MAKPKSYMKVQTIYDIGQVFFFVEDGKVKSIEVNKIIVHINIFGKVYDETYYGMHDKYSLNIHHGSRGKEMSPFNFYPTKEALIESL